MILMIDNYDSFTYNLYQYAGELYRDIVVKRNDEITLEQIRELSPKAIIISPGPGTPSHAGICIDVIKTFAGVVPILGVCLGHQAIGEAFGGKIVHAMEPIHGKQSEITINTTCPLFEGLPDKILVGRYHSLKVEEASTPPCLEVIGLAPNGEMMALRHRQMHVYGVQFHPESILTGYGKRIIKNFICHIAGLTPTTQLSVSEAPSQRDVLKQYIRKITNNEHLSIGEAKSAMKCMMDGEASEAQIGALLTALRMKGETVDEITGFAMVMREKAACVSHSEPVIDIVGTGGDMANTFNISTTAAFIAAGAGAQVAKHGNRSASGRSGSADVLEALSVKIDISPDQASMCLQSVGLCFMFAPVFHKSMKYAATPRREIGIRSVFNILGPLSNPASAESMLLGVYDIHLLEMMANVLVNLGVKSAMVVHGEDGLDEISTVAKTAVAQVANGIITKYHISPEQLGLPLAKSVDLVGGSAQENAQITLSILQGEKGPKRDIALLNAAAALLAYGLVPTLEDGIRAAAQSIDSGAAMEKLICLRQLTHSYS